MSFSAEENLLMNNKDTEGLKFQLVGISKHLMALKGLKTHCFPVFLGACPVIECSVFLRACTGKTRKYVSRNIRGTSQCFPVLPYGDHCSQKQNMLRNIFSLRNKAFCFLFFSSFWQNWEAWRTCKHASHANVSRNVFSVLPGPKLLWHVDSHCFTG